MPRSNRSGCENGLKKPWRPPAKSFVFDKNDKNLPQFDPLRQCGHPLRLCKPTSAGMRYLRTNLRRCATPIILYRARRSGASGLICINCQQKLTPTGAAGGTRHRSFLACRNSAPQLAKSGGVEGDADRAVNDIACDVLLHVSDQIIADAKLQVLKPGERTDGPANIGINQPRCGAVLTRDLLTCIEIRRKPSDRKVAGQIHAAEQPGSKTCAI